MRPASRYAPRRIKRARVGAKSVAITTVLSTILLIAVIAGSVGLYGLLIAQDFDDKRQTIDAGTGTIDEPLEDGELNVLLLGSDARLGDDDADMEDAEGGQRSDTMMLVHIPEDRESVYVMSLLRDLWVDIPGVGQAKINGALQYGGYPLVIDTVEELVGVRIDHLAIIDFDGFSELTTALGGVEVENPYAFSSGQLNPSFFPQGTLKLEGTEALRFVRERKAFLDGDYQRVENQQLFLNALMRQLLNADTLTNPARVSDVVRMFTPFITVDERLDSSRIIDYALSMRNLRPSDIDMFTIPNAGSGTTTGGASVVWQDEDAMIRLREAFAEGSLQEFLENEEGLLDEDVSDLDDETSDPLTEEDTQDQSPHSSDDDVAGQ